jgi:hypothetical protein
MSQQAVHDFDRVLVDVLPGDLMIVPGVDDRFGRVRL